MAHGCMGRSQSEVGAVATLIEIVSVRRPDPCIAEKQSPRAVIFASRRQLTLRLPLPCGTPETHATTERIAVPSSTSYKRENKRKNAFAQSAAPAFGAQRSLRATNETPRSTRSGIPRTPTNFIAPVPSIEPVRTASTATSVQAATELKALNAIASGPPEMHPNPRAVTAAPMLRFRFGFRAEPPKFARPSAATSPRLN